jgi:hypothetical protein
MGLATDGLLKSISLLYLSLSTATNVNPFATACVVAACLFWVVLLSRSHHTRDPQRPLGIRSCSCLRGSWSCRKNPAVVESIWQPESDAHPSPRPAHTTLQIFSLSCIQPLRLRDFGRGMHSLSAKTRPPPPTFRFGDAVRSCPLIAFTGVSPSSPTTLPRLAHTIATHGARPLEGVGVGSRHTKPVFDVTKWGVAPVAFHARPWHIHALGADPLPTLGFAIHRTAHVFVRVL